MAHLNRVDNYGETLLHRAATNNEQSNVQRLLSCGADANIRNVFNRTPLQLAATANKGDSHFLIINELLKKTKNINAQDNWGETALHDLMEKSNPITVKLLLDSGADLNLVNYKGQTPLLKAAAFNNTMVVRLLIKYGANK